MSSGFSLVEVTLALGIVTFCLLLLMGLLLVGLNAMKASRDEAAAVNCLEQISDAIRSGLIDTGSSYHAAGAYSGITWTLGSGAVSVPVTNLSAGGFPTSSPTEQQYVGRVELTPPADKSSPGTALISVAWPRQAQWNSSTRTWENAQGSVHIWLVFIPNP
ncbi:MAG: hypothetical protein ACAI35_19540 [Candidatus Methylacidiphilales bacterium]|nr:hypothetical protein [Candidatus Methylacidiphilales bacterium]